MQIAKQLAKADYVRAKVWLRECCSESFLFSDSLSSCSEEVTLFNKTTEDAVACQGMAFTHLSLVKLLSLIFRKGVLMLCFRACVITFAVFPILRFAIALSFSRR